MNKVKTLVATCIIEIVILFIVPASISASVSYYVSNSGSDNNSGIISAPFKSIQYGINKLQSGDTLFVRGGTYHEKLSFPKSGSAGSVITISGFSNETAIVDGTGVSVAYGDALVKIAGKSFINLTNMTIQNSDYYCVLAISLNGVASQNIEISHLNVNHCADAALITKFSNNITFKDNFTQESGSSGIGSWSSNYVVIDHNTVTNARNRSISEGGHEESISVASTTNFEVSNNEVYNTPGYFVEYGNEAIDIKESSRWGKVHHNYIHDFTNNGGALYVDAWKAGLNGTPSLLEIDIYNNKILNNYGGIALASEQGGTLENINVFNNVVFYNAGSGISVSERVPANGVAPGIIKNINISNNTVYKAKYHGAAGIFIHSRATTPITLSNIVIRNNAVYYNNYNGVIRISALTQDLLNTLTERVYADHNMSYHPNTSNMKCVDSGPYNYCQEVTNINTPNIHDNYWSDPQFINLTVPDLHLKSTSSAIDRGVTVSLVAFDLDEKTRPQGTAFDIGAYEYGITSSANTPSPTAILKIKGDANGDSEVDGLDYVVWLKNYDQNTVRGIAVGDFEENGKVDGLDYVIWLKNYEF